MAMPRRIRFFYDLIFRVQRAPWVTPLQNPTQHSITRTESNFVSVIPFSNGLLPLNLRPSLCIVEQRSVTRKPEARLLPGRVWVRESGIRGLGDCPLAHAFVPPGSFASESESE